VEEVEPCITNLKIQERDRLRTPRAVQSPNSRVYWHRVPVALEPGLFYGRTSVVRAEESLCCHVGGVICSVVLSGLWLEDDQSRA
jgi:hypothetical protein